MRYIVLLVLFILLSQQANSQVQDTLSFFDTPSSLNKKRAIGVGIAAASIYTATLVTVSQYWYKDFPKTKLHTFNDWGEWNNMDKYGHAYSAYIETKLFNNAARWTGLNNKKSAIASFLFSTLAQTSIEYFDGQSENWGWSWYDIAYNTGGSLIFSAQEYIWAEQKIKMKFSYTPIQYSTEPILAEDGSSSNLKARSKDVFGLGLAERMLKDYNAQTIWLSLNLKSLAFQESEKFPSWINFAVGYGANNMVGGFGNNWRIDNSFYKPQDFERYKQLFLSLDIDLERLPVKNKSLRGLLKFLNIFKIPSPTIEFNTQGNKVFHWLYF